MKKKFRLTVVILASLMSATFGISPAESAPTQRPQVMSVPAEYVESIIVKFRDVPVKMPPGALTVRALEPLSAAGGADLVFVRDMGSGAKLMRLPQSLSAEDAAAIARQLSLSPAIEYAEPDLRMYPKVTPNDPQYPNQWHLNDVLGGINAPAAWDITTGSTSSVVAVIDTGYTVHPDLDAKWLPGYDFITDLQAANDGDGRDASALDPGDWLTVAETATTRFTDCAVSNSSWHGTKVAGAIGASTQNNLNTAGIDWAARILPVRVLGKCGGRTSDVADAMLWAGGMNVPNVPANSYPAKILNLSLGSLGDCPSTYQNAINQLNAAGKIVVVAAGNDNSSNNDSLGSCLGVINVAATNHNGSKASYSNYGATVTLAAPGGVGGDFVTLGNTGATTIGSPTVVGTSGTSFSAPVVSGILSLMTALRPDLDTVTAKQILTASARPFPDTTCTTATCGAGIIDAAAALRSTRDQSLGVATFVSFQDADIGKPNPDLALTITNLAAASASTSFFILSNGADFSITGTTCGQLAAGTSCKVILRFNPIAKDLRTGELQISASDGRTYRVSLTGYAYPAANIVERSAGSDGAPQYIAKAPDGSYWYTQSTANRIARMTPSGLIGEYAVPTAASNPFDIVAGPDGNMWFTELNSGRIGRVSPNGDVVEFALPSATSQPRGITTGPDGNIWFTELAAAKIGRITPQGAITEFTIPWTGASPRGITRGPDGNLWFTDSGALSVGRVTSTGIMTRFAIPWASSDVRGIVTGPDGNLWFTELSGNRLGRVTTAGAFTEFPLPRAGVQALGISAGPDDGVWYTEYNSSRVGRVDVATGQITEYRLPSAGSVPTGIVIGPNNVMWITNNGVNRIASLSIPGVSGAAVYSDVWWGGTSENGWGMTVQQHGNTQFNVLFVYDAAGKPAWYVMPGCAWNGDYTACSGPLAKPTSSPLNNYNVAQFVPGGAVGTATLTYTSASTATLQYVINGIAGQKSIQRQVFGPADNTPGLQVGDMWWAGTAQNGWGVSISQQYRTLFAAWYTYDASGNVTWYTMPGGSWNGNTYTGALASVTSSPWLGVAYNPALFSPSQVGTVSFAFSDANNATMTYNFTAGPFAGTTQTKQLIRQAY